MFTTFVKSWSHPLKMHIWKIFTFFLKICSPAVKINKIIRHVLTKIVHETEMYNLSSVHYSVKAVTKLE